MKIKNRFVGVVAATTMAIGASIMAAPPAQAVGPTVCLSIKSSTYAYLEAYYVNWSRVRFINRGECSYNELPGYTLWLFRPGPRWLCTNQWGGKYNWETYYKPSGYLMITCSSQSGSW